MQGLACFTLTRRDLFRIWCAGFVNTERHMSIRRQFACVMRADVRGRSARSIDGTGRPKQIVQGRQSVGCFGPCLLRAILRASECPTAGLSCAAARLHLRVVVPRANIMPPWSIDPHGDGLEGPCIDQEPTPSHPSPCVGHGFGPCPGTIQALLAKFCLGDRSSVASTHSVSRPASP